MIGARTNRWARQTCTYPIRSGLIHAELVEETRMSSSLCKLLPSSAAGIDVDAWTSPFANEPLACEELKFHSQRSALLQLRLDLKAHPRRAQPF